MVVTDEPSAWTANIVHDLALRPSTSTVHAPHWLVSQPTCVPVRLRDSRRKGTSRGRASTSAVRTLPLTVTDTLAMGPPKPHSLHRSGRSLDRPAPSGF